VTNGATRPGVEPLGRLLSREVNVAEVLGYLVERDPQPLLGAFKLKNVSAPGIRLEARQGRRNRVDAFVTDGGRPVALMELKVGAAEHGNQFARYDEVATATGDIPRHLVSLDRFTAKVPSGWKRHLLPDLLQGWQDSPDATARVVATEAERALRAVLAQAAGPLGAAGRAAVAVAMRHINHLVQAAVIGLHQSSGAARTSGGQPMVIYWLPHPHRRSEHEWLCVDLRSEAQSTTRWKLRLGVEVDPESSQPAEVRAHDLAMSLAQALATSAFAAALKEANKQRLAAAVGSNRNDGFQARFDSAAAANWRRTVAADPQISTASPLFAHDRKRRLTTVSYVDYSALTVRQVADLVVFALRYLDAVA